MPYRERMKRVRGSRRAMAEQDNTDTGRTSADAGKPPTNQTTAKRKIFSENAGQLVVPILLQRAAEAPHRTRDGNADAARDQAVFDRGGTALIREQAARNLQ